MSFRDFCAQQGLSRMAAAAFEAHVRFDEGRNFNHRTARDWADMLARHRATTRRGA